MEPEAFGIFNDRFIVTANKDGTDSAQLKNSRRAFEEQHSDRPSERIGAPADSANSANS